MIFAVSVILLHFPTIRADTTSQVPDFSHLPLGVLNETRRILKGREVSPGTRPYMVYLKPVLPNNDPSITKDWLCGGVIIDANYILTSAACIENVGQFYIVSGTHSWNPDGDDECVKNGAKKAMWKCVLKYYNYDGKEFDNINWMHHDIAVVRTEDQFNFERRVRGCDFIPAQIAYNNVTEEKEKPKTIGSIAGWGSTSVFGDPVLGIAPENSVKMLETDVRIISKRACKRHWPDRYHHIIDDRMICTQDVMDLNVVCADKVDCKEIIDEDQYDEEDRRKSLLRSKDRLQVHSPHHHNLDSRRTRQGNIGGFCENDHGGPLIVGQGKTAMVVGIIAACQVKDVSHKCHGPFLYTSVYHNRYLISCAIYKEYETETCRKYMRDGGVMMVRTAFIWPKNLRNGKKSMAAKSKPSPESREESSENIKIIRESTVNPTAAEINQNFTSEPTNMTTTKVKGNTASKVVRRDQYGDGELMNEKKRLSPEWWKVD